jgi:hypothetical protein
LFSSDEIRALMADAWDEGYAVGAFAEQTGLGEIPGEVKPVNPYRVPFEDVEPETWLPAPPTSASNMQPMKEWDFGQ